MDLAKKLLKGDKRTLARLITLIENDDPHAIEVLKAIYNHTGKAHVCLLYTSNVFILEKEEVICLIRGS